MDVSTNEVPPAVEHETHGKTLSIQPPSSPPPNCAICLGNCTNKCFTDRCLHQFCFECLLEWSKRKPVCPLCKQPFNSIIYNIKSNTDYEEHIVPPQQEHIIEDIPDDDETFNFFLPNGPRPQRHFQFRTTLTLDPDGEVAVQQLLLSHPSTISLFLPGINRFNRNPQQTLGFRRAIYRNGWWAISNADVTGRYRECTPNFFRENPAQMHRITPWLNRELGAIISDYVDIYVAQQTIMESLCEIPVQSREFKNRVSNYFRDYTDHFIHEFVNFLRSPYDMIGYDSTVRYAFRRPETIQPSQSDSDDSDVRVVDSPNDCVYVAPRTPEVIVIHSDNSDSDVIYRTPTPPVVVDLLNSDTGDEQTNATNTSNTSHSNETITEPRLPLKMRFKLLNNSEKKKRYIKRKHKNSDSDSSNGKRWSIRSASRSSSNSRSSSPTSSSTFLSSETPSDSNWSPPLRNGKKTIKSKYDISRFILKNKTHTSHVKKSQSNYSSSSDEQSEKFNKSEQHRKRKHTKRKTKQKKCKRKSNKKQCKTKRRKLHTYHKSPDTSSDESITDQPREENEQKFTPSPIKSEPDKNDSYDPDIPGPSSSKMLPSVIVKGNMSWYSRPDMNKTSSNDSD